MDLLPNEKKIETHYRGHRIPIIIRKRSRSDPEQIKEIFVDDIYGPLLDEIGIKGEYVIDIGAYIGDTMILFGLHGAAKVFAFEPHPVLFKLAVKNARLNGVRFSIKNVGLSNTYEKKDIMGRATRSFGLGIGPFLDPKKDNHHQEITLVSANTRIHTVLSRAGRRIRLLKIDCEGFETVILPEITDHLKKIDHVIVECHGVRKRQAIEALFICVGMKIRDYSNEQQMSANKISTIHASW